MGQSGCEILSHLIVWRIRNGLTRRKADSTPTDSLSAYRRHIWIQPEGIVRH